MYLTYLKGEVFVIKKEKCIENYLFKLKVHLQKNVLERIKSFYF